MKKYIIALSLFLLAVTASAQNIGFRGIASEQSGLKMFINPSLMGYEPSCRLMLLSEVEGDVVSGRGIGLNLGTIGFGYFKTDDLETYTCASGSEILTGYYFGSSLRWFSGSALDPEYDLSFTIRPLKYFSFACNVQNVFQTNTEILTTNSGLAVRPFGDNKLTVEGGLSFENEKIEDSFYTLSLGTEIIDGLNISAGYSSKLNDSDYDPIYEAGLTVSLDRMNIGSRAFKYEDSDRYFDFVELSSVNPPSFFKIKNSKIVEIELEGNYKEEVPKGFFINLFGGADNKSARQLINRINKLKEDKEVAGILIKSRDYKMTFASREELRNALGDFKQSGKKIYSYFVSASQSNYYLLSVSDKIYMYPEGDLSLEGLGAELMFFKGILDKLGVKMQVIRHGKYKSAAEPFIQDHASPENIEQVDKFLSRLDDHLKASISSGRKMTSEELNDLMNRIPYYTGKSALENKLVDELIIEDKLEKAIIKEEKDKIKIRKDTQYFAFKDQQSKWDAIFDGKIAIVYATGSIMTGKSSGGSFFSADIMGSDTTVELIRKARKDKNVKAIVFRVDSGGGSALASDLILTELKLAQEEDKKPVIISMGSMAASGGYWISCCGDKIFADKSTLTGSIGVFGLVPSVDSLFSKIGINTQKIKKNKFAVQSMFEDMTKDETDFMQIYIDDFYKGFVEKV
ncbi:MAG: signal peptide peptidase SppA, partial [Candidatus Delongbacteria bacterium]|nr:signal peptide peptidase SppA [Candidatus Delongbacteria bacterium]MCG2759943.1 signal peptide peptidase SppA [Candidatus Delongbacteria bacterium]